MSLNAIYIICIKRFTNQKNKNKVDYPCKEKTKVNIYMIEDKKKKRKKSSNENNSDNCAMKRFFSFSFK